MPAFPVDAYKLALLLVGLALIGATWLPHLLKRHPLTFPIVYVLLGVIAYSLPWPLPDPDRSNTRSSPNA